MQKIGWTWENGILNFLRILVWGIMETKTINATLFYNKTKTPIRLNADIFVIPELFKKGMLRIGDNILFTARYSSFVPCLSFSTLFYGLPIITQKFSLPLRVTQISGLHLGALYSKDASKIYDKNIIAISEKRLDEFIKDAPNITCIIKARGVVINISQIIADLIQPNNLLVGKSYTPVGIFLQEIEIIKSNEPFYSDLWRLDLFPFSGPEETMYEFRMIYPFNKNWPNISRKILFHLIQIPQAFSFIRRINSFAVVPKINVANEMELAKGRELLSNFYVKMFNKNDNFKWFPLWRIGHGVELEENYMKAQTVFQYDQVNPVISQTINFNKIINKLEMESANVL